MDTYFCKIFEKFKKCSLRPPETKKKKIKNFRLKTRKIKKKNKKKSGSNDEKLRTLEPQQKQRVFMKKKCTSEFDTGRDFPFYMMD